MSTAADRSSPSALDGQAVSGNIHVFTHDTRAGVSRVRFWLDNPSLSGTPRKTENSWPHDFAGSGSGGLALPFDTTKISDGPHEITAAIDLTSGTTVVASASFVVDNGAEPPPPAPPPGTYTLLASSSPDRSNPFDLASSTVSGNLYVFTHDTKAGVAQVRFWLDNPSMGGAPRKTEKGWPHDFNGSGSGGLALAFDTTSAFDGPHEITAAIDLTDGRTVVVSAPFVIRNAAPPPEPTNPGPPDQIHLSWVNDPSTTLTVVWRTRWSSATPVVEYRRTGDTAWQSSPGTRRASGTAGSLHQAMLTGLNPATSYEYRVSGDNSTFWSDVFTARTAPPAGPATFDAIYLADTGIAGRTDGLTTGTRQVIEEVAKLKPLVVLPGGDYAYFDTEDRFSTLDEAIDAWFNQMQPVAAQSPLMPTYGNHEVTLFEDYGSWAARFATPDGLHDRRYYSFDIGEVHFVSIYATGDTGGITDSALEWFRRDVQAATAAGKQWIIPYWHASPFADGQNHPSNLALRRQLGPVLEELGIKLAISSHDQAYERTYPLTEIGVSDTPTSASLTCYGPDDGVVFAKVSPAGKLSNKNRNFSQFATEPAPHWTAVRSNTMHTFARILFSEAGWIRFQTYGVVGDGSPPVVLDTFELNPQGCPRSLDFAPPSVILDTAAGGSATASLEVRASDRSTTSVSLTDDAAWLTISANATTPGTVTATANAAGLPAGTYTANVTATAAGFEPATARVTLRVIDSTYRVLASLSSTRSNSFHLDGQTVSGSIYVFTGPDINVVRVRFWFDNPAMTGTPTRTENNPPFDFAGGSRLASPFDTRTKANGQHTITAALDLASGETVIAHSSFTIAN